jgi:hypothetical protein
LQPGDGHPYRALSGGRSQYYLDSSGALKMVALCKLYEKLNDGNAVKYREVRVPINLD